MGRHRWLWTGTETAVRVVDCIIVGSGTGSVIVVRLTGGTGSIPVVQESTLLPVVAAVGMQGKNFLV